MSMGIGSFINSGTGFIVWSTVEVDSQFPWSLVRRIANSSVAKSDKRMKKALKPAIIAERYDLSHLWPALSVRKYSKRVKSC